MVGTRIAPDNNDVVVWKLDDSGAPFVNSSTSTSSPGSSANLTVISGTVLLQQPSPFAFSGTNSCVQFTGNQSGSPRNTINGANSFLPQPPFTISMWYNVRNYDTSGLTQHGLAKQTTTGVWSGTTFASINLAQSRRYNNQANQFDFAVTNNSAGNGGDAVAPVDFNIPLNIWCHIGLTYDGTNVDGYINGNSIGSAVASPGGSVYYSGTPGPWFIGAIPSGSGSPEECDASYCDIRIANVIRPLSYFQNIYQNGTQNVGGIIITTKYYRMRAYDLGCSRPTPIYWTDSVVNYNNAPALPCGGPLTPIEILEIFTVPNG